MAFKTFWYFLLGCCTVACTGSTDRPDHNRNRLYQYSTIDALLDGVFEGERNFSELKAKGDFGIGTFNALDGELFINEGEIYRIRHDGKAYPVPDTAKSPLAVLTFFQPDTVFEITPDSTVTYKDLQKQLARELNKNSAYAIRINGNFVRMHTRAPSPAVKPYPSLLEHLKDHQHTFSFDNVQGTLVGFYVPAFLKTVNVSGLHFHFLTSDKKEGGHLFDFTAGSLTVEVSRMRSITVDMPATTEFMHANLDVNRDAEVHVVEKGKK